MSKNHYNSETVLVGSHLIQKPRRLAKKHRQDHNRLTLILMVLVFLIGIFIGRISVSPYREAPEETYPLQEEIEENVTSDSSSINIEDDIEEQPIYVPQPRTISDTYSREESDDEEEIPQQVEETLIEPEEPIEGGDVSEITPEDIMWDNLGEDIIDTGIATLTRYELPSYYYPNIDYSSFQSYMPYTAITDRSSDAYKVVHSDRFYIDRNGLCRSTTYSGQGEFTIDKHDDYIIALGTYYKPKGTCGDRWLIITSNGAYTCITGDEKADEHTDSHNMYTTVGNYCGFIEYLVDYSSLNRSIKVAGTVTAGPIDVIKGEIQYIYRIESN